MSKERDLLARAGLVIAQYRIKDPEDPALRKLSHQINAYFEEPEVNLEALGIAEIAKEYPYAKEYEFWWFIRGVLFAEKHRGIGGEDE
jgi:hypothetical protein